LFLLLYKEIIISANTVVITKLVAVWEFELCFWI